MRLLHAILAALLLSPSALAQCTPTLTGFQSGPLNLTSPDSAYIGALMPFDDGTGPALVAAGSFSLAAAPAGQNIMTARYRAGVWSVMPGLAPGTTTMRSLAVIDLSSVGGPGRSLYVGGDATIAYRWNGTQWASVGSLGGGCSTLLAYNDAQGPVLLAGGTFGILGWRGTGVWTQYAPLNSSGNVYALRVVDDGSGPALFALGAFQDASRGIVCIAKLVNGQWTSYPVAVSSVQSFSDLTTFDNGVDGPELYIAGAFSTTTTPNAGVARLHNGTWQSPATALNTDGSAFGPVFFKLDEGQGEQLFVGGAFQQFNQFSGFVRLVTSPSPAWQAPVLLTRSQTLSPGSIRAIARFNDGRGLRTYLGGTFSLFRTDPAASAISSEAFALIRATSTAAADFEATAQGLGELVTFPPSFMRYTLSSVDLGQGPRLFASSNFIRAGGRFARGAALFDGATWTPLNLSTSGGSGQGAQYAAVTTINGQARILSNLFNNPAGPVGYWDGAQWVHLNFQPLTTPVYAMVAFNNTAYVLGDNGLSHFAGLSSPWVTDISGSGSNGGMIVGDFGRGRRLYLTMSGPMGPGLYEFDGTTYSRLGTTFSNNPSTLCIHNDGSGPQMYVAAPGIPGYVGRFENNAFTQLVPGVTINGASGLSLASFDDGRAPGLYLAGVFGNAGATQTNGFMKYHAGQFTSVVPFNNADPVGLGRTTLQVLGNRLYLAGEFYSIGATAADHLAFIEACLRTCTADFNNDGDSGTDSDIESFFACLAGDCCAGCASPDFNNDGDSGTDGDIEAFFRVLAGAAC